MSNPLLTLQCIGTMYGKFKEKKASVVSALHEALDAFFSVVPVDKVNPMAPMSSLTA